MSGESYKDIAHCFICDEIIHGDMDKIMMHIDECHKTHPDGGKISLGTVLKTIFINGARTINEISDNMKREKELERKNLQ